jgi:hypothetical protein
MPCYSSDLNLHTHKICARLSKSLVTQQHNWMICVVTYCSKIVRSFQTLKNFDFHKKRYKHLDHLNCYKLSKNDSEYVVVYLLTLKLDNFSYLLCTDPCVPQMILYALSVFMKCVPVTQSSIKFIITDSLFLTYIRNLV